jgi:hypothetical protein
MPQTHPAAWLGRGSMISPTGAACMCSAATPAPPGLIPGRAFGSQPRNRKAESPPLRHLDLQICTSSPLLMKLCILPLHEIKALKRRCTAKKCATDSALRGLSIANRRSFALHRRRWQIEIQIAEHRHLSRHNGAHVLVIEIAAFEPARERLKMDPKRRCEARISVVAFWNCTWSVV